MSSKAEQPRCINCGTTENLSYGPDPYAEEIHGDYTDVWECDSCREASAEEI
jgi:hypothetical protein